MNKSSFLKYFSFGMALCCGLMLVPSLPGRPSITLEQIEARRAAALAQVEELNRLLDEATAQAAVEALVRAALRPARTPTQTPGQQAAALAACYSNNLASVSQWLHSGVTNADGTAADFQTLMDQRAKTFSASFTTDKEPALSAAWTRATNAGLPTIMKSAAGSTAVLMGFEGNMHLYNVDFNVESAQTISTTAIQPGGSLGFNLTGTNRTIYMWDGNKPRTTHVEFGGRVSWLDPSSGWYDLHATEVAGCLAAGGVDSAAKGMSCQANVRAGFMARDTYEMSDVIQTNNMRLSCHPYGLLSGWFYDDTGYGWMWEGYSEISTSEDSKFGLYSSLSTSNYDAISYSAFQYLGVWAAGNFRNFGPTSQPIIHWETDIMGIARQTNTYHPGNGALTGGYDTLSPQACAKNSLTVGAVNPLTSGYSGPSSVVMASFSSWGPTDDGRIKPDLVAAGVNIYTPTPTSNTSYAYASGTSMAAAAVAGSINLLAQLYSQFHTNAGDPLGSTFKALAIHTADQCGPNAGPNYQFGWGLMNTARAAALIAQDATNGLNHNFIKEVLLDNGTSIQFPVQSPGGTDNPLKVTIVWTDPPGVGSFHTNASSLNNPTIKLVNDLDLRVIAPSGATNFPYVMNQGLTNRSVSLWSSAAITGDNIRDNVEQVCLADPAAGTYVVSITHKGTLRNGSQWVSIILSGNTADAWQPQDFRINTFLQTATNALAIGWPAVVGQKYQVLQVGSLGGSDNWQPVGGQICARLTDVVTQVSYTNTVSSTFYRIVQIP